MLFRLSVMISPVDEIELPGWIGRNALDDRAERVLSKLFEKTEGLSALLSDFPPDDVIASLTSYDSNLGYSQLKPRLQNLSKTLQTRFGEKLCLRYGLALLARLIRTHAQRWERCGLADRLEYEFIDSFHRLLTAVSRGGIKALVLGGDAYAKEFAICLHRLIPAGGQLIDPGSGIPRSTFLKKPSLLRAKALVYLLIECGGRAPFAELHTNLFHRNWFTKDGWEYSFRLLPYVFESYPTLRGLMGTSWFFDPQIEKISPSLNFVRKVPLDWGAVIVDVQQRDDPESGALVFSRTRRALYESREYIPHDYLFIVSKGRVAEHMRTFA